MVKVCVVFDWDDTLFCTSDVVQNALLTDLEDPHSEAARSYLETNDKWAARALSAAVQNADTVVLLSNGSAGWIAAGMQHMPKTKGIIEGKGIEIVSARDHYQDTHSHSHWKPMAYAMSKLPKADHYVSVGDAQNDGDAPQEHCDALKACSVDFVKFQRRPRKEHVCLQLKELTVTLPQRVRAARTIRAEA